jgi:hypothetical protein
MSTNGAVYYSTIDAARMAGVTIRQLNHWASCGYLRPLRIGTGQQGTRLRWNADDVDAAARFGALASLVVNGGQPLLKCFAQRLAIGDYGGAVGVVIDLGRFNVCVVVESNEVAE